MISLMLMARMKSPGTPRAMDRRPLRGLSGKPLRCARCGAHGRHDKHGRSPDGRTRPGDARFHHASRCRLCVHRWDTWDTWEAWRGVRVGSGTDEISWDAPGYFRRPASRAYQTVADSEPVTCRSRLREGRS